VRVAAQLIDAASGTQLWSDNYDREFGDVLNLQDQVASGVARALQLAVVAEDARPPRALQSTEAYTFYLKGRAALDRGDESSVQESISDLEQALALDPEFTRAAEALAVARLAMLGSANITGKMGWPATAAAARRALQLDPRSALAHAILGLQHATFDYDWPAARAELRAAQAVNTRDPVALYNISWLAFDLGDLQEAVRLQDLSISIDPLNPDAHQNGGIIAYLMGDLDAAERELRASLRISPTFGGNHWYLGQIYLQRGDLQKALREMQAETSGSRDFGLALVYYALGRKQESDAVLARLTREFALTTPLNIGIVHAYRGERDQAFAWMEKAVEGRDLTIGHKFRYDPKLEPLRSDPRYKALLKKMNWPDQ
jgi:Tfp pilus assembly protein PilF